MVNLTPRQQRLGIALGLCLVILIAGGVAMVFPSASNQGYQPEQPIPFSHKLHAGQYKIDCKYCHANTERSAHASIPPVAVCMNCHSVVKTQSPFIQKIKEAYDKGEAIEWVRIHQLPDHAHFPHKRHIAAGLQCQSCHGPIETMDRVYQFGALNMGWCMDCHRGQTTPNDVLQSQIDKGLAHKDTRGRTQVAPINCNTCHY